MTSSSEILNLPTVFSPTTCTRKGLCPVTEIRNKGDPFESHSLYFEQHGSGPTKILFIMGLNSSSFAWNQQVRHFGSKPEYTCLVFDNRGVGNSGAPRGPYSTSGMADDAIALLDYVGWTEEHSFHVVGISLGGMISQELATKVPERIISLSLIVTTPGGRPWNNFPPRKGFLSLARMMTIGDPEKRIPIALGMLFPEEWLSQKSDDDPEGRTNREVVAADLRHRIDITKPQTFFGSISQMAAAMTHHVTPDRLSQISKSIGKVLILTGDEDHLVDPSNSYYLKQHMPDAELVHFEGTGHGIHIQRKQRFNALLEKTFQEGQERLETASS